MEQRKQKKKRGRAAFTLVEFLAVTAIVSILAALSFVAVSRYQRQLRRMEMDQTAKEIFLAAQNHLTLEVSDGTIPRLLSMDARNAFSEEEKTSKLGIWAEHNVLEEDETSGTGDVYVVIYRPGMKDASAAENPTEEIRARLLPFGSVDETVRADGSYLILYEPEAGLVREVWYSDRYQFVAEDIGDQNLTDAAGAPRKREGFTGKNPDYSEQKLPIGFYAAGTGDEPGAQDKPGNSTVIKFQAPTVKLIDGDILYVEITDPNEKEHTLRLFVGGETSGTQGYLELNGSGSESSERVAKVSGSGSGNAGTYQVILDDISASRIPGRSLAFSSLNGTGQTALIREKGAGGTDSFIPGENIYVYAQVFNNETLSSVETSNTESGNSLFAAIDDEQSAVIESFRHLENLDTRVSGFVPENVYVQTALSDPQTVTAMQNRDLLWKVAGTDGDESGYCEGVADLHERFGKEGMNTDAETMAIAYREAEEEGTEEVLASAAGSYLPVHPSYVLDYQGNTHRIDGLQVGETGEKEVSAVEGAGGVFGTVTWDLEVHNLWLRQPVIRTERNAGAVIGEVTSGTDPAGNTVRPRVVLEQIQVEYPQVQAEGADASAGALIGHFEGDALTVSRVLAENHFRKKLGNRTLEKEDLAQKVECTYRIRSLKGTGGGLVGTSKGELHLQNSAAALYVEGKNAGGLIGIAEKAARTAKQGRSTPTVEIRNCYVGGHTEEKKFVTSEKTLGGANANPTFENLVGRYNVAAYTGGFAGGLAAQFPAEGQISNTYVSASVYTPTAEEEKLDKMEGGVSTATDETKDSALKAPAFVAFYDYASGTDGKLPSEKISMGTFERSLYPGCYVCSKVNEKYVLAYAEELSELFASEGTKAATGEDANKNMEKKQNAYPYDLELKNVKIPIYPMPTIQKVVKKIDGEDASKGLSWFLKNHVGDWDKEEKEEKGALNNGNRLYIDYVSPSPLEENKRIYLTFSITGELSGKTMWYVILVDTGDLTEASLEKGAKFYFTDKEGNVYSRVDPEKYPLQEGETLLWKDFTEKSRVNRFEIGITDEKQLKLRFYLDDLSREGGNFCSLGTWGGYQAGGYINGENVTIRLSENGYPPQENTEPSYRFNSCFADLIEPNDDGKDTYTVKVANGRHLQNLNFCGDGYGGLTITRVIQTDNILWREDNLITSQTEAYCKEIEEAYGEVRIYSPGNSTYESGGFWPINNPDIISYDAKIKDEKEKAKLGECYTIARLRIYKNVWDGAALFQKTDHLTISNLNLKDPEISCQGQSTAGLVAQAGTSADSYLTLENIRIYGEQPRIFGSMATGAAVGSVNGGSLKFDHVVVEAPTLQISGGKTGGLIGEAKVNDLVMNCVYVSGKDARIGGTDESGGIVGSAEVSSQMKLENSFFSGYVDTTGAAGGLYGHLKNSQEGENAGKEFSIKNSYVGGRNRSYGYTGSGAEALVDRKNVSGGWCAGGLVGWMEGSLSVMQSFSAADVYGKDTQNARVGGLFGSYVKRNSTGLVLSNCYTAGSVKAGADSIFLGHYIGQLNERWGIGGEPEAGSISVTKECWYLPQLSEVIIGAPCVDSSSVKDNYSLIIKTDIAVLSSKTGTNSVEQTTVMDDSLQGKAYPYPIWTIYEPAVWQTGKCLYVGDWD